MADYSNYSQDRKKKTCRSCMEMLDVQLFRRRSPEKGSYINNVCRQCEQRGVAQYRTKTKRGISAEMVRRTKHICKTEGLPFDLTPEWVEAQLEAQEWACALTKIKFYVNDTEDKKRTGFQWDSISVDRIVNKGGYTKDNVRFILNCVNLFRNDGPDDRMFMVAKKLVTPGRKQEKK